MTCYNTRELQTVQEERGELPAPQITASISRQQLKLPIHQAGLCHGWDSLLPPFMWAISQTHCKTLDKNTNVAAAWRLQTLPVGSQLNSINPTFVLVTQLTMQHFPPPLFQDHPALVPPAQMSRLALRWGRHQQKGIFPTG